MNAPEINQVDAGEIVVLANLIHLTQRARRARDVAELAYVAMNETHLLAPYRQAVLWLDGRVVALSGVVSPEDNAPYVHWITRLIGEIANGAGLAEPQDGTGSTAGPRRIQTDTISADVREEWDEWLPECAIWLQLPAAGRHFSGGGWLLARDESWSKSEMNVLQEWADIWTQAWALAHAPGFEEQIRHWRRQFVIALPERDDLRALGKLLRHPENWRSTLRSAWSRPSLRWGLAVIVAMLFPVRLSVLAPAELVPAHPAVIRAPLDGVIERILVTPNQSVKAGDVLFEFDRATLSSRLAVAEQALATADAEYRQFAQQALMDDKMKVKLVVSLGTTEEKKTELSYLRELHGRATVSAPQAGIAIFDDPTEWSGRPVTTGEKVMLVAEPLDVEIEAWLSLADAIDLQVGASVTLYLNTRPLSPISGDLRYLAHEAQQRPDGHYAYRLRAAIPADEARARAGLKGTAKVAGNWVPTIYWVLRKPLAALRNLLGI